MKIADESICMSGTMIVRRSNIVTFATKAYVRTNYKRGDFYQVENEEMSCASVRVSYELLDEFFHERGRLDRNSKDMMFNPFTWANRFCGLRVMSSEIEITENRFARFSCRLVC